MSFEYNFTSHFLNSPGYLFCDVPECVKEELKKTISDLEKDKIKKIDNRLFLAGHIDKEYVMPITPNIKYLVESMSHEYDKIFLNKPILFDTVTHESDDRFYEYQLKSLWINYSKKHDFNPIHSHSGAYSFVIWVNIPFDLEKEMSKYQTSTNSTSLFSFHYVNALGKITNQKIYTDKTYEWKMVFFPAELMHSVNPFYSSKDYRISISGNVFYSPI